MTIRVIDAIVINDSVILSQGTLNYDPNPARKAISTSLQRHYSNNDKRIYLRRNLLIW